MLDTTNDQVREVMTPDGIGTVREYVHKDNLVIKAKVCLYDKKGKATEKLYLVEELEEIDETLNP